MFPTVLDIRDGHVPYISSATFSPQSSLSTGDVVIADTAEDYTAGKALEVVISEGIKAVPGLHTIACHPKISFASGFLGYYFNSSAYKERLRPLIQGIKVYSISKGSLATTSISFPLRDEQYKIGLFLSIIDRRIAVQNKIIEDLERLRKFINDAFFESLKTKAIFRTLYKIASEGGTPDTNLKEYYVPAEIPFIKIEDLFSKYLIQNSNYISALGIEHSSAWLVPKGSILLSNGATIGECAITTYPLCTKQGILGIVPSDSTDSEFLYYLFKSTTFKKQLQRITTKGTMDAAYLKDMDRIQIPFCDKTRQEQHVKTLVPLERKIVLEQSLLQNLIALKRFLLAKMFI